MDSNGDTDLVTVCKNHNVDRVIAKVLFAISERNSCLDKRRSPKLEISWGVADREQQAVELGGQPLEQYNVERKGMCIKLGAQKL